MSLIKGIDFGFLYSYTQYIFLVLLTFFVIIFVYKSYLKLIDSGFTREQTLDIDFLVLIFFIAPFFIIYELNLFLLVDYFVNSFFIFSVISSVFLIFILSKLRGWSFYKLLDIYSIEMSRFLFFISLTTLLFGFDIFVLVFAILMLVINRITSRLFKTRFTSFFKYIHIEKSDELSFIGGNGLIFLIYIFLIATLNTVFFISKVFIINLFLIFLVIALILVIFKYIKKSKESNLAWHLQINLLNKRNKNLQKEKKNLKTRLLG